MVVINHIQSDDVKNLRNFKWVLKRVSSLKNFKDFSSVLSLNFKLKLCLYSVSKVLQRLEEARSYCTKWYIHHWSWWRRRLAPFIWCHMWHEWPEWSWRDSHQSRQRDQKFSDWMWWSWVLLTWRPLHRSYSVTTGESHQSILTLWTVYQVRVLRLGIFLQQQNIRMVGVTWWPRHELLGRSLSGKQTTNLRMRRVKRLRKLRWCLQLRCKRPGMARRRRLPYQ